MNRKTILAFSIVSTVALVLLIVFAPMAETHQAHAFWELSLANLEYNAGVSADQNASAQVG